MKMKNWSTNWKSSINRRKQRKYRLNAPLHIRGKFLSAHLSKELRQKHKKRAMPLRKGDAVKVMRGSRKGETGKIDVIDRRSYKVYLAGFTFARKSGQDVLIAFDPSKLMITNFSTDDKKRMKERKAAAAAPKSASSAVIKSAAEQKSKPVAAEKKADVKQAAGVKAPIKPKVQVTLKK